MTYGPTDKPIWDSCIVCGTCQPGKSLKIVQSPLTKHDAFVCVDEDWCRKKVAGLK